MVLRIGIVGTGMIGDYHGRALATSIAGAQVVAVSDVNVEQAKRLADAVGNARVHADGHDLIRDDDVQAVLVASPGDTHEEYTSACIAADKPVLCEKPLATTTEACLRVLEAEAARPERLVQVGFMRRYDDGYRAVKEALDSGLIGRPVLVHCVHRNATLGPTFTSDMLITDSVVHEIDITRWLLGQEITAITVFSPRPTSLAAAGVQDPQLVLLESADGVLIDVEMFVNCQYGYDIGCEVVGERGTAALPEPGQAQIRRDGRTCSAVPPDWRERFARAYHAELQAWVDGVLAGKVGGPSSWDGYAVTAVAEAGLEALAQGRRTVVDLIERPALYA